jgi:hypothetical protein
MTAQFQPVVMDVISEVLEKMFYAMVDFDDNLADKMYDFGSEIRMFNPRGWVGISLQVSEEFARMITANLLGVNEDQVGEDDLLDALRELANMIGGNCQAYVSDEGWSLGLPRAWRTGGEEGRRASADATELRFGCLGEAAGRAVLEYVNGSATN